MGRGGRRRAIRPVRRMVHAAGYSSGGGSEPEARDATAGNDEVNADCLVGPAMRPRISPDVMRQAMP